MSRQIPEGWINTELGAFVSIQGGYAFKSEDFCSSGVSIVRISNINKNGSIDLSDSVFSRYDSALKRYELSKGDALIAMSGATTGKVGKYKSNNLAYLNQRVGRFKIKDDSRVENDFIYQVASTDHFINSILIDAAGGAQPNISSQQIEAFSILLPPLPEQQKIATILTSVDTVIEKTRAQIDKLKHLKTGMMQELLTQGIGHTEFKDTPVGRIPKAWRVVQFKDVFTLNYGKSPKDIIAENGANTVWGTGGETAKTNNFLYEGESIVLGRKGTIDQPRYVTGKFWVIDTAYYSSNHGENNVRFLHYALQIKNLKALNEASGVPSLSRDTLYAEWLALPDPLEQKEISKILHSIEVKIAAINKKLSSFEKNKKALMQDLLTGTIRV